MVLTCTNFKNNNKAEYTFTIQIDQIIKNNKLNAKEGALITACIK